MVCALDTMHIVGRFLYFYRVLALEIDAYTASFEPPPQTPISLYNIHRNQMAPRLHKSCYPLKLIHFQRQVQKRHKASLRVGAQVCSK